MKRAILGVLVLISVVGVAGEERDSLQESLDRLQEASQRLRRALGVRGELPAGQTQAGKFAVFSVADLVTFRQCWLAPDPTASTRGGSPLFSRSAEEGFLPVGTEEELMELVRSEVCPDAWEEGILASERGHLFVVHRPDVLAAIEALLDGKLRERAHRGLCVEVEIREGGSEEAGEGELVWAGRATGTIGSTFHLWEGRQVATLADFDFTVEIAGSSYTTAPVVHILQPGALLEVTAEAGGGADRLRLDVRIRWDLLQSPIPTREIVRLGTVEMPVMEEQEVRASLDVPLGSWIVAGSAVLPDGRVRRTLVRARQLERTGGGR